MTRFWLRYPIPAACALLLAGVLAPLALGAPADTIGMDWSQVPEYRMVPGDLLRLDFGPLADVRELRVRPDGRISVYPVGDVIAAGLTPRELELSLVRLLSPEQKLPRVTVDVVESPASLVHVLGRVRNPASVPLRPFMTALQAITAAGGFGDDAARNSVLVFHRDGARNVRVVRARLDRAIKSGDLEGDVLVGRFDIVYVPRSTIANVDQFSRQLLTGPQQLLQSALTGWELFNLDKVFFFR